jgi:hypothetical protein
MFPMSGRWTLSSPDCAIWNSSRRWVVKAKKISELMDIANRFADGEDTYHNKKNTFTRR